MEELVRKADIALLSAKTQGKNRVEYYDGMDASSSYRRLDLEKNMRTAAMNACTEFEVFYQPIIDVCQPGEPCCGAEALIRWNSSALGFVNPADFYSTCGISGTDQSNRGVCHEKCGIAVQILE